MKSSPPVHHHKPFADLGRQLRERAIRLPERGSAATRCRRAPDSPSRSVLPTTADDERLFFQAMAGVVPLGGRSRAQRRPPPLASAQTLDPIADPDHEALDQLRALVRSGRGFDVSRTPEYMEGTGHRMPAEWARRLHRGEFSIQAHMDLHGMTAQQAEACLRDFFRQAMRRDHRAVLIVHGRGLCSPSRPVLKGLVQRWLITGPYRRWVVAYASARSVDGGAGATYVLLRKTPLTRRHRKRRPPGGAL